MPIYGELGFRWLELASPTDTPETYLSGAWKNGFPGTDYGYATYYLTLLLPERDLPYGIKLEELHTAYELRINGDVAAGAGQVGRGRASTRAQHQPQLAFFEATTGRVDITVQLANFRYPNPMLTPSELDGNITMRVGTARQVTALRDSKLILELFMIGAFLIIALYHLSVVVLRAQDNGSSLYFGLFCLMLAVRDITNGEIVATFLLPRLPFELQLSVDYAAAISLGILFVWYLHTLFPQEIKGLWLRALTTVYLVIIGSLLVLPARTFGTVEPVLLVLGVITIVYSTVAVGLATYRKRESSRLILAGVMLIAVTSFVDIIDFADIVNTGTLSSYGFLAFVLVQAFLIAQRGAQAYDDLEALGQALEQSNDELETRVSLRTADLELANREIHALNSRLHAENVRMGSELDITRRLQELLLPAPEEFTAFAHLDIAATNLSASEVAGDYYDILPLDARKLPFESRLTDAQTALMISIGDVTGHGLESGMLMLMTQMGVRTLLEVGDYDPVMMLDVLNRSLQKNIDRMAVDKSLTLALVHYCYDEIARQGQLYVSGQHETLLVVRADGQLASYDTLDLGFPLGLTDDIRSLIATHMVTLAPGDGFVLYTDGIPEAPAPNGQLYGLERMSNIIQTHWQQPAQHIQDMLLRDVHAHIDPRADLSKDIANQELDDDITVVVFKQV